MKNFKMEELVPCFRENGARCRGCRLVQPAMQLPDGVEGNLVSLVEEVLEPVRERLGRPIVVNSGYRCPIHNAAVGGVANSQHLRGEAADLHCYDNRRLARIIVELGKFDQVILYPTFVHISFKKAGGNRKQILRKTATGYSKVAPSDI